MIALDPVLLTGGPQDVKLNTREACCALIVNESGFGLKVKMSSAVEEWLPAWTADKFDVPAGSQSITLTPVLVGSLVNAPSKVVLITLSSPGERILGTYPAQLTRQASLAAGQVTVENQQPPTPVNLENSAGNPVGDVSELGLSADRATIAVSPGPGGVTTCPGVIASFKAAAGQTIALRGVYGAFLTGSNTQVAPAFGQATAAGNLLTAQVDTDSDDPSTTAAGWTLAIKLRTANGLCSAIFYKKNCGAGEAAPVFTASGGLGPMTAQLAEWTGADTVSPLDQTGSAQVTDTPLVVAAAAVDAAAGDLVLIASHWGYIGNTTVAFSETLNNGAIVTNAGNDGSTSQNHHASHAYGILPGTPSSLPLGISGFPYDIQTENRPAAGTAASVTIAGVAGKKITLCYAKWTVLTGANAFAGGLMSVLDGASEIWADFTNVGTNALDRAPGISPPSALVGTVGNSMTIKWNSMPAAAASIVEIGAYQR